MAASSSPWRPGWLSPNSTNVTAPLVARIRGRNKSSFVHFHRNLRIVLHRQEQKKHDACFVFCLAVFLFFFDIIFMSLAAHVLTCLFLLDVVVPCRADRSVDIPIQPVRFHRDENTLDQLCSFMFMFLVVKLKKKRLSHFGI